MSDLNQEDLEQLATRMVQLGRSWLVLGMGVALAQHAPELTEDQLRARLAEVAALAERQLGGETG